jgi:perosamine synthetase
VTAGRLAIDGGAPVRDGVLPYGRQSINDDDIAEVARVLRGDWLTTGPDVARFEGLLAQATGSRHAVAVSNGTAALHAMLAGVGVGPGDEVLVPAITFAATSNAAVYLGATPVFVDVEADTLLMDVADAARRVTPKTRAIVAVDYAGQPCDWPALRALADQHGLALLADGCHALGATLAGRPVGSLADATTFSFHPVKHVAAGEGGAITTDDPALDAFMRRFRTHGISRTAAERAAAGTWSYEMVSLGYNYRLTDMQSALAASQLGRLPDFVARRRALADAYAPRLAEIAGVTPLTTRPGREHAWHLYVVRWQVPGQRRAFAFDALRAENIGVNVHYLPVHLHAFYQERFGTRRGLCPVAEAAYDEILTLPLFPDMSDADLDDVVRAVHKVASAGPRS